MSSPAARLDLTNESMAHGPRKPPQLQTATASASAEQSRHENGSPIQQYFDAGYTAVSNALIDHWMSSMSGPEFKIALLFLRKTIGDRDRRASGDLHLSMKVDEMVRGTGADREAVIQAIRALESKGLVSAERAHRRATVYLLNLEAVLRPWVGISDSKPSVKVGIPDSSPGVRVGKADSSGLLRSGKPTQNACLESGFPTPYKEKEKAATAAAAGIADSEKSSPAVLPLTAAEWGEVRRIERQHEIQLDGKSAVLLKAAMDDAKLTLSHFRWFLRDEKFIGARNRMAVLLTIAREFRQRSEGIAWPGNLDDAATAPGRSLTPEELFQ